MGEKRLQSWAIKKEMALRGEGPANRESEGMAFCGTQLCKWFGVRVPKRPSNSWKGGKKWHASKV